MVELWFYSGRLGNCMFAYAFNRCLSHELRLKCQVPKGTEIALFPSICNDSLFVNSHDQKYTIYNNYKENNKTILRENDNISWFIEPQFLSKKIGEFKDNITIQQVLDTPKIDSKWIVTLGNFEIGYQYLKYRELIKSWFAFPAVDLTQVEFFKLHPDLGSENFFIRTELINITEDDLLISLRLEDYTSPCNKDRLLDYDYFKIILSSRKWNKVYIMTNPGSIGHNDQYNLLKEFVHHDPIFIRCYNPVMSMALGAKFNNIAISQSTYSWWLAFLSEARNIYYPIPREGPFSLKDRNYIGTDLRVSAEEFKYVDYTLGKILPEDYFLKIDCDNRAWTR